jgi:hypothetical protein
MDLNHYPIVWPQLIPALEAALPEYEQATANMADFKKRYTSMKNKVKRTVKYVADMDEATREQYEHWTLQFVQLAENKFIPIDKKLKRFCGARDCKTSLKLPKASKPMEPNVTVWHIQRLSAYLYNMNSLLREVDDMLRIAKKHLSNVDHIKKQIILSRKCGLLKPHP